MNWKNTLLKGIVLWLSVILHGTLLAQVPTVQDCLGAIPVCDGIYYQVNSYVGTGNYPNEIRQNVGCPAECMLDGEKNDVWYIITVLSDGELGFLLTPNNSSDDYDWAVYDLTFARCEDIYSTNYEVSCNWSATPGATGPNGGSGISCGGSTGTNKNALIPVNEGEIYVINISNWSSTQYGYTLDFSPSTAAVFDTVPPFISFIYDDEISGCSTNELRFDFSENVKCNRVIPSLFSITGPGGPYDVIEMYGAACEVGGEWEKQFTLTVDKPFASNGDYNLIMGTGINGIVDACDNIAYADTIPFTLNLGAPTINAIGLTIQNSTCGVANGSITGLTVNGQGLLSYLWTNQAGDTVGTSLDLLNVPAGNYLLEVKDNQSCMTQAGPYQVQDEGAPVVDESQMDINPSFCDDPNGSITGITVDGTEPFDYEWVNGSGTTVGNDIDLTGALSGSYTLIINDANGCEVISGPHDLSGFPGPSLVEDYMEITPSTCDEANGSITGIFSSGSTTLFYAWYDGLGNLAGTDIDLLDVPAGQYSITISDENGCDTVGGPYLIEGFPPAVVDATSISITSSTCGNPDGAIHSLSVSGNPPYTYEWRDQSNALVGTDLDLTAVPGGQYTLHVFDGNTCETVSGPYMIPDEGGPEIEVSSMTVTPSNCHQSDGMIEGITATGHGPIQYSWKDDSGNEVGSTIDLSGVPEGNYTLEAEDVNGCVSYSGPHYVSNLGGADITLVQSLQPTCEESNGEIHVTATGGLGSIEYSIDGGQTWVQDDAFTGLAPGAYEVMIRDDHGCETVYGQVSLVNEGLAVLLELGSNGPVCEGDPLELTSNISGAQYSWTGPDGFISTEQNPVISAATMASGGTYTLDVITSPYSCQGTAVIEVEVVESFEMGLTVTASENPVYRGEEVEFTVAPDPEGFPGTYVWYLDGTEVQSGTSQSWSSNNLMDGQVVSSSLLTNSGCILNNPAYSNEVVMEIRELPMYFPNSIRPNSTMTENREFKPRTVLDNIARYKLRIYNKWGQKIFESTDVNEGWDGMIDGKIAPLGVYVYMADYQLEGNETKEGEKFDKKGSFVLVN